MLFRTHQLDETQLAALDSLCEQCKSVDGNLIAIYRHLLSQDRPIPCNVLYYQNNHLIGFLRTFFFYHNTCEISVMVSPNARRQHIALQMMHEILPLLIEQQIETLIFSSPHGLNDTWLKALGFIYQGSEYQMRYHSSEKQNSQKISSVRQATLADLATLCIIDEACFSNKNSDMSTRFQSILEDPNYTLFIISQNGVPVGKAHLYWQQDEVRLTDIAVLPRAQGQGFGSTLINHCIQFARAKNKSNIVLDVETDNQHALNLYLRLGFIITNAHDYWQISLKSYMQACNTFID